MGAGAFSDLIPGDAETARQMLPVIDELEGSDAAAQQQGVPVDQVASPKGALGRYQVMPSTGALYGYGPDDLRTGEGNTSAALATLADLADQFGPDHKDLIAAGYNGGPRRARAIAAGQTDQVPAETQGYLSRALKILANGIVSPAEAAEPASDPFSDLVPGRAAAAGGDAFADLVPQRQPQPARVTPNDQAFLDQGHAQLDGHAGILNSAKDFVTNLFAGKQPLPNKAAPEDTWMRLLGRQVENLPAGAMKTVGGLIQSGAEAAPQPNVMMGGANDPQQVALEQSPDAQYMAAARQNSGMAQTGRKLFQAAQHDLRENAPNVHPDSLKGYASDVAGGVAQMAPLLLASAVTKSAAPLLGGFALQGYGDKYGESRAAGRSPEQADSDATFSAAAQTIPAMLPLHVLMKPGGKFIGKVLQSAGAMSFMNAATTALQKGYDAGVLKEDMTWGQAAQEIVRSGLVGAATGALFGVGGGAAARIKSMGEGRNGAQKGGAEPQSVEGPAPEAPPPAPVDITPDRTTGLVPVHDPVTWAQTGWRDAAGNVLPLDAIDKARAAAGKTRPPETPEKPAENVAPAPPVGENGQNPENSSTPDLTAQIDQTFRAKMEAANPGWAGKSDTTSSMLAQAITTGTYNDALHPNNRNARATFEQVTGVKLPATVSGTKAMFKGQPFQAAVTAPVQSGQGKDGVSPNFTTTPGKIRAEHEAEVSSLEAQGTAAARPKPTVPPEVENPPVPTKVGNVRGAPRAIPKDSDHAAAILARAGGIRDDEGHDLVKGRGLQQFIPGVGKLIRPTGMSADAAGELLWNQDFFGPHDHSPRPTENQVLQLLERTRRGDDGKATKVYTPLRQAEIDQGQESDRVDEANQSALEDIHGYAKGLGETLSDAEAHQIMADMGHHGIDHESAVVEHLERKAIQEVQSDHEETGRYPEAQALPVQAAAPGADHGAGPGVEGQGPAAGAPRGPGKAGPAAPSDGEGLKTEPGAAGLPQTIVPGSEASAQQLAQAQEVSGKGKIKPKAPQKDAGGMFEEPEEKAPDMFEAKPVTAEQARDALKTNIDPRTGTKPKGNAALRDFREEMQGVVSHETPIRPVGPKVIINHVGKDGLTAAERAAQGIEKDTKTPESVSKESRQGDAELANVVQSRLDRGAEPLDQRGLMALADKAYGGTAGQGAYDPRRAYDAMETGINQHIAARENLAPTSGNLAITDRHIEELRDIEKSMPIQSRRTGDTDAFQQFSTPPHYAYAAAWAANMKPGDVVLEPSAGNGGLAVFAKKAGAKVVTNELGEGRRANLERQGFDQVTGHDAEQINNLLPKGTRPSVVLMNPPFSNAAERGIKDSNITGRHIDQAMKTLAPGGRLVAITGHNFMESNSRNRPYFQRWAKENRIKASVGVAGKVFSRYGTSYPTRVIIIDKAAPDGRPVVTGEAETAESLIDLLKGVRDERPDSKGTFEAAADQGRLAGSEPASREPGSEETPGERGRPGSAVLPATGGEGTERPGSRRAEGAPPDDEVPTGRVEGGSAASRDELHSAEGSEPGSAERPEAGSAERGPATGQPDDGEGAGLPAAKSKGDVLSYEGGKNSGPGEELAGGVYSLYKPQRLVIAGAKPHPAELVQSAAMASVEPPEPKYKPALHPDVISKGKLSEAQLEPVVYAGQAHEKMLPDGETRRGFFIGDGTGVGKGREIAGVILDNTNQGRRKHVWVTEKWPLLEDAKRDWTGVGGDEKALVSGKKFKQADAIAAPHGILFTTYDTLKGKPKKGTTGQTRVDQIVKWLGPDFDGVVAFDEAHNMANADAKKGKRGKTTPAEKALAGLELQKKLPKARILYVSATGATEVRNLAYADRLGLWGPGTAFPTKDQFMAQIETGGVAAMELVARDLKQMGSYLARGLSFNGVEYGRLEHKLTGEQRGMYDSLAEAWQMVLQNIDKALEVTGGAKDGRTSSAAYSAFWGGHQRFFNQVLTSMQMPTALDAAAKDIAEGRSPVFQLVNTNEAATERALARVDDENPLEDLDLTPRDQLMQLVQHSFPVAAMERYTDENGNEKSRPVLDAAGNVVEDRDAVAIRDKVLDDLSSVRVPDGPLEYLLNRFGPDTLAEVTGRGRRVVERNGKRVVEKRPGSANTAEADAFMSGKKKALVFSQAGGTGRSYHADKGAKNQARRVHYLLQPGWSAAPAIQGFGRTHRSNQTSKPEYRLTTTDVVGQKRFVSSIARRLDQLGALTKGERRSGGQGFFTEKDNLESQYAEDAVTRMVTDILGRKAWAQEEGLTPDVLTQQMGLRNVVDPRTGAINVSNIPDVTQFLNRLLSLKLDMQDKVFNAFDRLFEQNIEGARAAGTLDQGVEQLKADHIEARSEQVVHTDADSGAQTKYVALQTKTRTNPTTWDDVQRTLKSRPGSWLGRGENGRTYLFTPTRPKTNDRGGTEEQFRRIGTLRDTVVPQWAARQKFEELEPDEAEKAWQDELDKVPEFDTKTEHMVTGALLPIWDRLPKGFARVMRAKTDGGQSYLGRIIPNDKLQETLKNLGATGEKIEVAPNELFKRVVESGDTVTLANGWKLQRRTVAGEKRMRLNGPNPYAERAALERLGAQFERVGYEGMFFVPDNEKGRAFLEKQLRQSPIVSLGDDEGVSLSRDDRPAEPPFFSALTRAVEGMKQEKAPAEQWAGMIRNAAGVKQEERDWSGVEDWLADQKGPVTKDALLQQLRDNEVQVHEVMKGGDAGRSAEVQRAMEAMTQELRTWTTDQILPFQSADELLATLRDRYYETDDKEEKDKLQSQIGWLSRFSARWEALENDTGTKGDTKWSNYTLPGGKNYRELLLTKAHKQELPAGFEVKEGPPGGAKWVVTGPGPLGENRYGSGKTREEALNRYWEHHTPSSYKSSHWDEPNILAHVRFDDREVTTPGFVVRNTRSGNTSDAFDTREEAEAYQNQLPESARAKTEIHAVKAGKTKKVLHVAEIQSDWHQAGRKRGYKSDADKVEWDRLNDQIKALRPAMDEMIKRHDYLGFDTASEARAGVIQGPKNFEYDTPEDTALAERYSNLVKGAGLIREKMETGVPEAPFKHSWHELAMKRVLRHASENGYDAVTWDTGATQAKRFGLARTVRSLDWGKRKDGNYDLTIDVGDNRPAITKDNITIKDMADLIGQEMADKIVAGEGRNHGPIAHLAEAGKISGGGLEVGGEGQKGFYDDILPKYVNKLGKKWGAKVERGTVPAPTSTLVDRYHIEQNRSGEFVIRDGHTDEVVGQPYDHASDANKERSRLNDREAKELTAPVHRVNITPEMRESVLQGQPLFQRRGGAALAPDETTRRVRIGPQGHQIEMRFTPKYDAARKALGDRLVKRLEQLGLHDVALKIPDAIRAIDDGKDTGAALGTYWNKILAVALESGDHADRTIDHEGLHALRRLGLIDERDWQVLANKAPKWIKQYRIKQRYAAGGLNDERTIEEAAAHAFEDRGTNHGNLVRRIFQKIAKFLEAVRNALHGLGFRTAHDVFASIDRGDMGAPRDRARAREPEEEAPALSRRDQTDTEEFKRWFGKSKVVDSDGRPIPVYHGTNKSFDRFSDETVGTRHMGHEVGPAFYFTDKPASAEAYARSEWSGDNGEGANTMRVYLKMENPLEVDFQGMNADTLMDDVQQAKEDGHDGLIALNIDDADNGGSEHQFVVFDKRQIKSAIGNRGTFDPNSDRIDLSRDNREDSDDKTTLAGRALGAIDRVTGHAFYDVGKALNRSADRIFPDSIKSAADAVQMAVTPMAAGSAAARATAKDFANQMRAARVMTGRKVDYLNSTFEPDRLAAMWEAADEESVLRQQGEEPGKDQGLSRLSPQERKVVKAYQAESNELLRQAQEIGLFKGEGLPSYVPRMVVTVGNDGRWGRMGRDGAGVRGLDAMGRNVKTNSPNLRHRKHLTTEQTEEAAQGLDESAAVVKDIRTLPLAMGRLQEAIAGRTLIDRIKAMGQDSGDLTVSEGAEPNSKEHGGWFTIDHPAFKTYRPSLSKSSETGKWQIATNADGDPLFERVPLFIRKDFEGPLRAVLSQDSSQIYKAAMALKGKTMSVIMYSPLMHNAVIWGKAFPAAPLKLINPLWRDAEGRWHTSIELYGRGRAAKNDPAQMREALDAGLDPIGHRYFNQDISAIVEQPNVRPGRSWTAQLLGYFPGLFDKGAGDAVRRRIDQAGDVWHNKLLWDLVGDLQMGMFQHLRDAAIKQGNDAETAGRYAAHFSNRYAGALPIESMSRIARQTANIMLFSRSFTLTNLGAFKDIVRGLPKDVQAQVMRDKGLEALNQIQGAARRKGASLLLFDIFLSLAGLVLAQHAAAWLMGHVYHPPSQNEPDREHRALIGYDKDGTALYARLPTGKVGEELQDWTTEPVDVTKRKLSPFAQAFYGVMSNDRGFGRKVYDPYDKSALGYAQNIGRVAQYIAGTVAPVSVFQGAWDLARGRGDKNVNWLKLLAPMAGVTISKGAPGGPAVGQLYASKDEHEFQVQEQMPEIHGMIQAGDLKAAVAAMTKLGLTRSYQKFVVRVTQHPGSRMTKREMKDFMGYASPDEKARMKMYMNEGAGEDDQHSAVEPSDLGHALKSGSLERFARDETWTRDEAISAAQGAGLPATAALLRDAKTPVRPELREKVLGQAG